MFEKLSKLVTQRMAIDSQIEVQAKKDIKVGQELWVNKNGRDVLVEVLMHGHDANLKVKNSTTGKEYWVRLYQYIDLN